MVGERRAIGRALIAALLVTCTFLLGCGGQKVGEGNQPETEKLLRQLMLVANKYRQAHSNQLPTNEAAFKKFANGLKPADLEEIGVTDLSKIWVSPRDNQPFVVRYGLKDVMGRNPSNPDAKTMGPPVFAYEKTGFGGKRWVITTMGGSAREVDEAEFKGMVPDAK